MAYAIFRFFHSKRMQTAVDFAVDLYDGVSVRVHFPNFPLIGVRAAARARRQSVRRRTP
jgi:hypothetical protein